MKKDLTTKVSQPDGQRLHRVIEAYEAEFPDPWRIRTGERLAVSEKQTVWEGWLWCTKQDGTSRWVPGIYVQRQGDTGLALCDYDATELSVHSGEALVSDREAAGWLWCTNQQGQSGWVPAENLTPLDRESYVPED